MYSLFPSFPSKYDLLIVSLHHISLLRRKDQNLFSRIVLGNCIPSGQAPSQIQNETLIKTYQEEAISLLLCQTVLCHDARRLFACIPYITRIFWTLLGMIVQSCTCLGSQWKQWRVSVLWACLCPMNDSWSLSSQESSSFFRLILHVHCV